MKTVYSYKRLDLFYIVCVQKWHQFLVYTSKKQFLYVLQYLNISFSWCLEELSCFVLSPLCLVFPSIHTSSVTCHFFPEELLAVGGCWQSCVFSSLWKRSIGCLRVNRLSLQGVTWRLFENIYLTFLPFETDIVH